VVDTAMPRPVTVVATGSAVSGMSFRHHRPAPEPFGPVMPVADDAVPGETAGRLF
jgi:hypothetical protein